MKRQTALVCRFDTCTCFASRHVVGSCVMSFMRRYRTYLVHVYTASTLVFVTLGFQWLLENRFRLAIVAMGITIVIDATDGMLARRFRVKETAAGVDGSLLDNVVDFLSYVALPMLFMMHAEMLLAPVTLWVSFVMFASAFGFSRTTAKLADEGFFVGFPSYWNILVAYLYLLSTPPLLNTLIVVLLSLLVFVPVRFLYVSRLRRGRSLHLVLATLWGGLCVVALPMTDDKVRHALLYVSLLYPAFYTLHSLMLDLPRLRSRFRPELSEHSQT